MNYRCPNCEQDVTVKANNATEGAIVTCCFCHRDFRISVDKTKVHQKGRPKVEQKERKLHFAVFLNLIFFFGFIAVSFALIAIFMERVNEGNFEWFRNLFHSQATIEKQKRDADNEAFDKALQQLRSTADAVKLEAIKQQKVTSGMTLAEVTRSLGHYESRARWPVDNGGDKIEYYLVYPNGERVFFDYDGFVVGSSERIKYTSPRK